MKYKRPRLGKFANTPCCRADPSSAIDQFEPREPIVMADAMDISKWRDLAHLRGKLALEMVDKQVEEKSNTESRGDASK